MTVLGTALRPAATKVMLLGSGELGKEVAIECQRLGIETIAVDRYPDAPADAGRPPRPRHQYAARREPARPD